MDKLLKMLGLDTLDESKQSELKEKVNSIIDVKVTEQVTEKISEKEKALKEDLTESYEKKFDTYKDEITEKFSNFVDEILDQELVIDPKIIEFARKGELYEDLIEQFKTRLAIDEGILDTEVKEILSEARDEIKSLKDEVNLKTDESLTLKVENNKFKITTYLSEKVKGLPIKDAEKVVLMLEDETDTGIIDKKFETIKESILNKETVLTEEEKEAEKVEEDRLKKLEEETKDKKEKNSPLMEQWANSLKEDK